MCNESFARKREPADHEDAPRPEYADLVRFGKEDIKWFESKGCDMTKVYMEPGDFGLWDLGTKHYAKSPEGDQIRHVQYVRMIPKKLATDDALKLKDECDDNSLNVTN